MELEECPYAAHFSATMHCQRPTQAIVRAHMCCPHAGLGGASEISTINRTYHLASCEKPLFYKSKTVQAFFLCCWVRAADH